MFKSIFMAFGLVFILEGILPFLAPGLWRQMMQSMLMQNERALRIFGLSSMLIGLIVLYLLRNFF